MQTTHKCAMLTNILCRNVTAFITILWQHHIPRGPIGPGGPCGPGLPTPGDP